MNDAPHDFTARDLRPGDIMFAKHVRPRSADLLISLGQVFVGQPMYPHHVGVIVEAAHGAPFAKLGRNPRMVQAMPGGAQEVDLDARYWTEDYAYVRPAYLDESMAQLVADAARLYIDVPYSLADYLAIAGLRLGIKNGPVRRYVTTSKHMICSQLADQAMTDAGWHTFNDGRLPQDVTPGGLYAQMLTMHGVLIRPGGRHRLEKTA